MKDKSPSDAITRIRDAMIARGISSPSELARRLGVPRQTVHRWLNGDVRNMTHEHLFRLGDVLNISGRWLALGDVDPSKYKVKDEYGSEALMLYREMPERTRTQWLALGRSLLAVETDWKPSRVNPFSGAKSRQS